MWTMEFETTRVKTHKGLIVGYGKRGIEEKSPIHIADIVRMLGLSITSSMKQPDQQELIRGILRSQIITLTVISSRQLALARLSPWLLLASSTELLQIESYS